MIQVVQGFKVATRDAVDNRILLSKAEMKSINDSQMPDKYFAICKDDGCLYLYDKERELTGDEETGKFVLFAEGSIDSITIDGDTIPINDKIIDLPLITEDGFGLAKPGTGISAEDGVISIDFNSLDDKTMSFKKVNFDSSTINASANNISVIDDEINTRVRLWKDTDKNLLSLENDIIPLNGEIVIVESDDEGIRYKVGDGKTPYSELDFADKWLHDQVCGIVIQGIYDKTSDNFYVDDGKSIKIVPYDYKLYIDKSTKILYAYSSDEKKYYAVTGIDQATSTVAGIMKLYDETGDNTDGTMTQRSITSEIAKKFVVSTGDDEDIIFTNEETSKVAG